MSRFNSIHATSAMNHDPFLTEMRTERLHLAQLSSSDAPELYALTNDDTIAGVVHYLKCPFNLNDALDLIENADERDEYFIGVRSIMDGALLAVVGLHHLRKDGVEISYWVGYQYRRRGYAMEATSHVVKAIHHLHPEVRVIAECRRENSASWSLLEKLGFRPTGLPGRRPGREALQAATQYK